MLLQKKKGKSFIRKKDNIKKDLFDNNKAVKLIKLCDQQKNLTSL